MSALTHVGNLVPHSKDRTAYYPNGKLWTNEDTGLAEKFLEGSPRIYFPLREDMKLQIMRIIRHVLQVSDNVAVPAKMVRYPQEEGDKKAKLLDQRIKWLVECLKTSRTEAQDLATKEYFHFFQPENIDEEDPLGSITDLLNLSDQQFVPEPEDDVPKANRAEVRAQYQNFYRSCAEKLIWQFPMLTYKKSRYGAGDKLELLSSGSKPPARTLTTVNAWTITNIATRLGQTGEYSVAEEVEEAKKELDMVHPAFHYGARVNRNAQADSVDLDTAKSNQVRTFRALRARSTFGDSTVQSTISRISKFMRDPMPPASNFPEQEQKISTKGAQIKEKTTSNTAVLGDTGSQWSSIRTGPSLATTTANFSLISRKTTTPLRQKINDELEKKGKSHSIPQDPVSSDDDMSLPDSCVSEDFANQAALDHMMEETLEQIQETSRKRPKNLLLGKLL